MANTTIITAQLPLAQATSLSEWLLVLPPWKEVLAVLLSLAPVYLLLVRLFRNHNLRRLHSTHPYSSTPDESKKPLAEMPLSASHDILRKMSGSEFPYMFNLGLQFALVRTYAIPTVSD